MRNELVFPVIQVLVSDCLVGGLLLVVHAKVHTGRVGHPCKRSLVAARLPCHFYVFDLSRRPLYLPLCCKSHKGRELNHNCLNSPLFATHFSPLF